MAAGLMLLGVASSLFIAAANILLGLAFLAWISVLIGGGARLRWAPILLPFAFWIGWLLVSALSSPDRATSFGALPHLLTLLLVPMALSLLTRARWDRFVLIVTGLSAVSSLYALWQTLHTGVHLDSRATGFFSHYMTYAGWTMTVVLVLAGELIRGDGRRRVWITPVLVLHTSVLALSLTRNAWVGLAAGLGLAAILWRPRPVLALPLVAVIAVAVLPAEVRERISSISDLEQHANQDRIAMIGAGLAMVADHPLVGVGPDMVGPSYPSYRKKSAVRAHPSHLHCNPVHIAAENGLPALAAWIAILGVFAVRSWRAVHDPEYPAPAAAASALLAVAGLTVAGLFEYNWGDSEIWILEIFLLAVPFALAEAAPEGA